MTESRIRTRVEYIFDFMDQSMNKLYLRSVQIARVVDIIGLINLSYNLFRYEQIVRLNILQIDH